MFLLRTKIKPIHFLMLGTLLAALVFNCKAQSVVTSPVPVNFPAAAEALVTISVTGADGATRKVGTGLVVRSDGIILTAQHLVKGASAIQVKLRNGETFDHVEVVKTDERRNAAFLRIPLINLAVVPQYKAGEDAIGVSVYVLALCDGQPTTQAGHTLSAISLANEITGAGEGFRVLKFTGDTARDINGGALVDENGNVIGLLAAPPNAVTQNYAVPLSHVLPLTYDLSYRTANNTSYQTITPAPVVQVAKSRDPFTLLSTSHTVYVDSRTTFFKPAQLINELGKRDIVNKTWGWQFIDVGYSWNERNKADLEIEIDHQILTFNFTFTLKHRDTGIILASGKATISDGASGAPQMADRIIEKVKAVLNPPAPKAADKNKPAKKS